MGKKYVVLDFDECLGCSFMNGETIPTELKRCNIDCIDLRMRYYSTNLKGGFWGVERPHLRLFLDFLFEYFDFVCVWSAGKSWYVKEIVSIIFEGRMRKPDLVMTWDHVEKVNDREYHKPLTNFYKLVNGANHKNTIMLDNRYENFIMNKRNGVVIPSYEPEPTIRGLKMKDDRLLRFAVWILENELNKVEDVTTLNILTIFSNQGTETQNMIIKVNNFLKEKFRGKLLHHRKLSQFAIVH